MTVVVDASSTGSESDPARAARLEAEYEAEFAAVLAADTAEQVRFDVAFAAELAREPDPTADREPSARTDAAAAARPTHPQDAEPPEPTDPIDSEPGVVVTVFSPKGGVGTTFVATNLAVALADAGRRRVCLVDLDLEFGDVAITCGVPPNRTIVDLADAPLDAVALDPVVTPLPSGIDAVLAPVDPAAAERVTPALVAELLGALRRRYRFVVVDTPSQLSEHVLEAFDAAAHQVIVTTPELPALKNVRLLLDTLELAGAGPGLRHLVLNRAQEKGRLTAADVATAIRTDVDLELPVSPDVPLSVDAGRPLLAGPRRDDPIGVALRRFADVAIAQDPARPDRRPVRFGLRTRRRAS